MADYERQVAAQLGIAELLLVFREFGAGGFPKPRQVLGIGVVFAGLSVAQSAPEPWQRVASTFGWLVVLAIGVGAVAKAPNLLSGVAGLAGSTRPLFPQWTPQQKAAETSAAFNNPGPLVV